ncbi:MAG: type II secretion system F family protein [Chloroflexota bacterium]|nr:type II secretion system F family protein [Chloroflexota bacterium]
MIPILLVGLFALGAWFTHEAWTTPVGEGVALPPRRWRRVQQFLHRAGLHDVTPRDFVLFSLGAGVLAGGAGQFIMGWPLVSIVAAGIGAGLPFLWYASREDGRRARVQAELADAMSLLRDSIRAGGDVAQGLAALASYGPTLLKPEFERAVQLMAHGSTLREALLGMRERLADPVFDSCVATLLLNERLGSPQLTPVLSELAQAVRDELRVQADFRARRTRVVLSARVIAAIPLVMLIAIRAISPHYLDLFDSVEGQLILGACATSVVIGYQAMRWTSRLPVEQRVLVE